MDAGRRKRGGEFASFFDGLEALRARVEDPLARKRRLDVDFAGLRDDLTRHIARFELFRPLLWAFFQGLLRADARLLAEMLLTVLIEALPAANEAGGGGLEAACRFVANGARELSDAGAPGVANRVVLHALARFERRLEDADAAPGPPDGDGDAAWRTWPTLLRHLLDALPIERDRQSLGYVRRVLERALRASHEDAALRATVCDLWAALFDHVLRSVSTGARSPSLDHLLVRIDRLAAAPGMAALAGTAAVLDRLAALPRLQAWWAGYIERQSPTADPLTGLPASLADLAIRSLRTGAPDESAAQTSRRLRALATIGGPAELDHLAAHLTSDRPLSRRAAVEAIARFHQRFRGAHAELDAAVVRHLRPLLDDGESDVRRAAVRTFGELGAPDMVAPLLDLYRSTGDAEQLLRAEILEAVVPLVAALPAARAPYADLLRSERTRHAAMARGRLRDRILAALETLCA